MRPLQTLGEKQAMMRDRVKGRPCADGRSKQARRARARLIKAEDVIPRLPEYVVKRRAMRFMLSHNYSRAYIANQLGMSPEELEAMIREDQPERDPAEAARALLRQQEREKRRDAKDLLAKLWKPETEVTFVTAFAGEVDALSDEQRAERRKELAAIRQRESRDAGEGRRE